MRFLWQPTWNKRSWVSKMNDTFSIYTYERCYWQISVSRSVPVFFSQNDAGSNLPRSRKSSGFWFRSLIKTSRSRLLFLPQCVWTWTYAYAASIDVTIHIIHMHFYIYIYIHLHSRRISDDEKYVCTYLCAFEYVLKMYMYVFLWKQASLFTCKHL